MKEWRTPQNFWPLLMNLKNKYLLKKMLKWANKKQNNFNTYNTAFFLKKITQKIKILKKMKKIAEDIIILPMCTKNMKVLPKIMRTLELPGCQRTFPEIKQPYHLSCINCSDDKQHTLPSESY